MTDNKLVGAIALCFSISKICLFQEEQFQRFKITVGTIQRVIINTPVKNEKKKKKLLPVNVNGLLSFIFDYIAT